MNFFKHFCLTIFAIIKPSCFAARQRAVAADAREVERLDRIRNPSKYRGVE
jgi:hypothetical protein